MNSQKKFTEKEKRKQKKQKKTKKKVEADQEVDDEVSRPKSKEPRAAGDSGDVGVAGPPPPNFTPASVLERRDEPIDDRLGPAALFDEIQKKNHQNNKHQRRLYLPKETKKEPTVKQKEPIGSSIQHRRRYSDRTW